MIPVNCFAIDAVVPTRMLGTIYSVITVGHS